MSDDGDILFRAHQGSQARAEMHESPADFLATYGLNEDAMRRVLPLLCEPAMRLMARADDDEARAEAATIIVARSVALGLQIALERDLARSADSQQ